MAGALVNQQSNELIYTWPNLIGGRYPGNFHVFNAKAAKKESLKFIPKFQKATSQRVSLSRCLRLPSQILASSFSLRNLSGILVARNADVSPMAAISNLAGCGHAGSVDCFRERRYSKVGSLSAGFNYPISWPKTQLAVCHLGKDEKKLGVRMALVDDRLALVDGTFTRRLAQEFPTWQFLLVDLWCHGDSASIKKTGPNTVSSTALDVLKPVRQLRITPRILVGHSFGGKVALSMVEQAAKPLARPVKVWVLDATPGKVRPGGDGEDHPAELISVLKTLPKEVSSKRDVVQTLVQKGFSKDVAQWVVTNLQASGPLGSTPSTFSWTFDLNGISEMYQSYEDTNLWKILEDVPRGIHVNFLKAERSLHRWALEDLQRIHAAEELAVEEGGGVEMHVLEDAGHWVHADNPDGLFRILTSSFQ